MVINSVAKRNSRMCTYLINKHQVLRCFPLVRNTIKYNWPKPTVRLSESHFVCVSTMMRWTRWPLGMSSFHSPRIWPRISPEAHHFCPSSLQHASPLLGMPLQVSVQPTANSLPNPQGHGVGSWQPCSYRAILLLNHGWIMVQEWIPDPGWANSRSFPGNQSWTLKMNQKLGHSSPTFHLINSYCVPIWWALLSASAADQSESHRAAWFPDGFPVLSPCPSWGPLHCCPWVLLVPHNKSYVLWLS